MSRLDSMLFNSDRGRLYYCVNEATPLLLLWCYIVAPNIPICFVSKHNDTCLYDKSKFITYTKNTVYIIH